MKQKRKGMFTIKKTENPNKKYFYQAAYRHTTAKIGGIKK